MVLKSNSEIKVFTLVEIGPAMKCRHLRNIIVFWCYLWKKLHPSILKTKDSENQHKCFFAWCLISISCDVYIINTSIPDNLQYMKHIILQANDIVFSDSTIKIEYMECLIESGKSKTNAADAESVLTVSSLQWTQFWRK